MHVGLLGRLQVCRYGKEITIPAKPQLVLAALTLHANSMVSTHQLVDELWGDKPPASATRSVQTYVYQVRKFLQLPGNGAARDPERTVLLTRQGGYELRWGRSAVVDVVQFTALLERARVEIAGGQLAQSFETLETALGLWRGQPLAGLELGPLLSVARVQLEQARRSAVELRIDTKLQLGHHREILDELHGLVLADPTDEGFSARLMTALHGCGRRAEALGVYHRLRQNLSDELGVQPSASVQRVFQDVLNDERASTGSGGGSVAVELSGPASAPRLPPRPSLVGRDHETARLRAALVPRGQRADHTLRVTEVIGGPGMGTSSFVLNAAHEFAGHYRDGALFVDLRGIAGDEQHPVQLLGERLAAAGVPLTRAGSLDEVAGQFEAWAGTRQHLVVVDHVASARVLTVLRPSGPGSAMIVVSQFGTPGQVGDTVIELGALAHDAAMTLLENVSDRPRIGTEPAAARLVELCEGNPLAICAVGRWVACLPRMSLDRVLRQLEEDPLRLSRLWWAGRTIEDSVRNRVQQLSDEALTALVALSHSDPATGAPAGTVAARLNRTVLRVEAALDELTDAHLVDEVFDSTPCHRPETPTEPPSRQFRMRKTIQLAARALALRGTLGSAVRESVARGTALADCYLAGELAEKMPRVR